MSARVLAAALALASCTAQSSAHDADSVRLAQEAWATACEDWADWDKPGPPYAIGERTYYVGTCGISAILVTGDQGHVLIDSGTEAGAETVARNIQALGFDLDDVEILLMSHEHFDHVGGMARLQQLTGARLLTSAAAAPVMRSGRASDEDPQAGMHEPFAVARVDGIVDGGEAVRLGDIAITAIATPGHTPGAMSWTWSERIGGDGDSAPFAVVYADSLSPISSDAYRFGDHPEYVRRFREGIGRIARHGPCLLLTPHPSASEMRARITSRGMLASDADACRNYASGIEVRLDERLAEEAESE